MIDPVWLGLPGFAIWFVILLLPWRPWSTRESVDPCAGELPGRIAGLTVLIPARNERECISRTLHALALQDENLPVILIDDQSTDDTVRAAADCKLRNLTILPGQPLPAGWTGKLWALEQGRTRVTTPYLMLLDADIELLPGIAAALLGRMKSADLAMVSVMARLRMTGFWEKLLMPAFIYFFKLLYPFALANSTFRPVAAAAGGCILLKRAALEELGGFGAIRGRLIDDCALAAEIKRRGHRTWIGLSHAVISHRVYAGLAAIWAMVARTAYTQLRHSAVLLTACSVLMSCAFVLPVFALFCGETDAMLLGASAVLLMALSYCPLLAYYELNPLWSLAMPAIGTLFLLMTWSSALQHWRGAGAVWKGRSYPVRQRAK